MKSKQCLQDIDVNKKLVLYRAAYDIALEKREDVYTVSDNRRIRETVDSIKYLLKQNCRIVILSWLKRPEGKFVEKFKVDPIARELENLLGQKVKKLNDCVGKEVEKEIKNMKPGEIIMLENTRFHPEEQEADQKFAKKLAGNSEIIIYDAFAQAHRIHASTTGILKEKPSAAGLLVQKEFDAFEEFLEYPKEPFVLILGGAKISDKVDVIEHLLPLADLILVGGGLANTFIKALGYKVGNSLVEGSSVTQGKKDIQKVAKKILKESKSGISTLYPENEHGKLVLPVDFLASDDKGNIKKIDIKKEEILGNWSFYDIGPKTVKKYKKILKNAGSVVWNGPLGKFEEKTYEKGTKKIAQSLSKLSIKTIVCGGDTEEVVKRYKLENKFYHVSTGGGAALVLLSGKKLVAIEAITNKK